MNNIVPAIVRYLRVTFFCNMVYSFNFIMSDHNRARVARVARVARLARMAIVTRVARMARVARVANVAKQTKPYKLFIKHC